MPGPEQFFPSSSYDQSWRHRPEAYEAILRPQLPSGELDGPYTDCRALFIADRTQRDLTQYGPGIVGSASAARVLVWVDGDAPEPQPGESLEVLEGPNAGLYIIGDVTRAKYAGRYEMTIGGAPRTVED